MSDRVMDVPIPTGCPAKPTLFRPGDTMTAQKFREICTHIDRYGAWFQITQARAIAAACTDYRLQQLTSRMGRVSDEFAGQLVVQCLLRGLAIPHSKHPESIVRRTLTKLAALEYRHTPEGTAEFLQQRATELLDCPQAWKQFASARKFRRKRKDAGTRRPRNRITTSNTHRGDTTS